MQEHAAEHKKHRLGAVPMDMRPDMRIEPGDGGAEPPRAAAKAAKKPWILRLLLALGAVFAFLGRLILRLSRKNPLLALGFGLFMLLFIITAYNGFFRQKQVARPVLFSTRAVEREGGAQPYVARAISTEALSRQESGGAGTNAAGTNAAGQSAAAKTSGEDEIGALILADNAAHAETARRQAEERAAAREPKRAAPAAKIAVPQPRPPAAGGAAAGMDKLLPTYERVLRLQKALRKAGDSGIAENGKWTPQTRAALRRFKKQHGLADNDEINAAVIRKMQQLHLW